MNRIRVWIKKHKICTASICIILILLISALCVSPFVAIHIDDFRNMGCSSVVFDKRQMNGVDRIVVKTKNGETTIRDKALIRRMVKETMTATSIGYKVPYGDNEWRLYKGDTLIRRMRRSSGEYRAILEVFQVDGAHRVSAKNTDVGVGEISAELLSAIEQALAADGNSYAAP